MKANRFLAVLALVAAAATASATADTGPQGGGANNVVIVRSTADRAWQARSHVEVATVAGSTVASANLADAMATSCTGCRASAVAVQVLFVTGSPNVFTPANAATAVNSGCDTCATYAFAWQYVLQTSGPVYLSPTGRLEVEQLRQQIGQTVASIDPTSLAADEQLTEELESLTGRLEAVVDAEVQAAGVHANGSPVVQIRRG
jgi:hypothetical protein